MIRRGLVRASFAVSALSAGCSAAGGAAEDVAQQSEPICSSVTVTSNDADNTAVPGQVVTWTATGNCTGTAEYQFWLRTPSGTWTMVRDWNTSNQYAWNTAGQATGQWQLQVWIRDTVGNYQAYQGKNFILSSSVACTGAVSTPSSRSVIAGAIVNFANSAATCVSAEYQIYHQAPGGAWTIDSPYNAANFSYNWNTTNAAPGTHYFQIWVRAQGSTQSYQAYASTSVTVSPSTPCTNAALTFSPARRTTTGKVVTLTPSTSGCASPTYQIWYQPPGGAWTVLQPYTNSTSIIWNTTGSPAGNYNFQVWARVSGSASNYDTYRGFTYTLDTNSQTSALAITGGWAHNCELTPSGKVGCWGYSGHGEVGNGTIADKVPSPVAVTGITQGISLAAGYSHTCAVILGGTVRCWGSNLHGQLGNGGTTQSATPVAVSGISNAAFVAAGNSHSCAALADGTAACWGYNSQGQLGNGTKGGDRTTPVAVSTLTNVSKISAGYYHSCALLFDGTVRCWGLNNDGQLGNNSTVSSVAPVQVFGLNNVIDLSTDGNNNCATRSDGTVWCWGQNTQYATLGSGSTTPQTVPVQVNGITTATSATIGIYHGCATLQNGTATCWGYNFFGQLGNNTATDSTNPVAVANITGVASIGLANYTTCAALTDGSAQCWGYGILGSLGNGDTQNSRVPVAALAVP